MLRRIDLCKNFAFANQAGLADLATKVSTWFGGAGSTRFRDALTRRTYRIINMPSGATPVVLADFIASTAQRAYHPPCSRTTK